MNEYSLAKVQNITVSNDWLYELNRRIIINTNYGYKK